VIAILNKVLPLIVLEISNKSTQGFTSLSPHENVIPQQPIVFPAPSMVPLMFSSQYTEPNLNTVDIDELSASLGLPSAKKETTLNASPACSNNSDASQGVPKALYGKLIDRALSTPLTAHTLAHYMKSRSDSSEETVKAIQGPHDAFATAKTLNQEHGQALKVVRPPPGFANQIPRMVVVENEHPHMPTGPAAMQQKVALAAPSGYFQQHPNMVQSATPLQHHARHNSNRRRPRTHTRTKRTDQGPEPSAADIYPDDAHWTPTQYTQQNYFAPRQYVPPPPQLVVRTGDASSWPTPAEVYTHEPQAPPAAHVPQAFDIFEAHTMPTAGDLGAADSEVLSLIEELPAPTIQTLMHFGAVDLLPEDRSLSPDQQSGKRYGVNFYGIGIGDDWQPPPVQESDPFRVRPRDHSGWGGWEWAIKKGWADA
jgi:hypothetical protein